MIQSSSTVDKMVWLEIKVLLKKSKNNLNFSTENKSGLGSLYMSCTVF